MAGTRVTLENKFFKKEKKVGVILLFLEEEELMKFIYSLKRLSINIYSHVTFVASGKWGTKRVVVRSMEDISHDVITFQKNYGHIQEFKDYFTHLNPMKFGILKDYWIELYGAESKNDTNIFFEKEFGNYSHLPASDVINSVNAFVSVFDKLWKDGMSISTLAKSGKKIMSLMNELITSKNVLPFNGSKFHFNPARINSQINIYNYQKTTNQSYE